jgi:hypothetical protein
MRTVYFLCFNEIAVIFLLAGIAVNNKALPSTIHKNNLITKREVGHYMPNINQFISTSGILSHQGLCLIHNYYTAKQSFVDCPVFVIDNMADLAVIFAIAPAKGTFGVILRSQAQEQHRTPMVVRRTSQSQDVVILDSLGTAQGIPVIQGSILKCYPNANIVVTELERQSDFVSCGTDAFLAMKQALRMGDDLFAFFKNTTSKEMPATIAKYTQNIARIKDTLRRGGKPGIYDRFPNELKTQLACKKSSSSETIMTYIARHASENGKRNLVLDQRREKHQRIITTYVTELSDKKLDAMVQAASGLSLMLAKPKLLERLFAEEKSKDAIYELIGVKKSLSSMTVFNFKLLSSSASCKLLHAVVEESLNNLILRFLSDTTSISLFEIAQHVHAKSIIEEAMNKCLVQEGMRQKKSGVRLSLFDVPDIEEKKSGHARMLYSPLAVPNTSVFNAANSFLLDALSISDNQTDHKEDAKATQQRVIKTR